jgi:hypothetical protein
MFRLWPVIPHRRSSPRTYSRCTACHARPRHDSGRTALRLLPSGSPRVASRDVARSATARAPSLDRIVDALLAHCDREQQPATAPAHSPVSAAGSSTPQRRLHDSWLDRPTSRSGRPSPARPIRCGCRSSRRFRCVGRRGRSDSPPWCGTKSGSPSTRAGRKIRSTRRSSSSVSSVNCRTS